jgi:hypothetical protein
MVHKVEIGAAEFFITKYPPFQGLEIFGDLQQRFGAPLLEALGERAGVPATSEPANPLMPSQPQESGPSGGALAGLMAGFARISATLSGKDITALAKRLLDPEYVAVSIEGRDPVKLTPLALAQSGIGPDGIIELCWEVVRFNFAPFITRFSGRIGTAVSRLPQSQ